MFAFLLNFFGWPSSVTNKIFAQTLPKQIKTYSSVLMRKTALAQQQKLQSIYK